MKHRIQTLPLLLLLAAALPCSAANLAVPCTVPDLINAIQVANSNSEPDTIDLAAGCTYTLSAVNNMSTTYGPDGLPVLMTPEPVEIRGHGATIVRSSAAGYACVPAAACAAAGCRHRRHLAGAHAP